MAKAKPDVLKTRPVPPSPQRVQRPEIGAERPTMINSGVGRTLRYALLPHLLRWLRKQYNIGVAEMARKLGVSVSRISELELGRRVPTEAVLRKVSCLIGVRIDGLMLLQAAAIADREFANGGSLEKIRERVVVEIEAQADLRRDPAGQSS